MAYTSFFTSALVSTTLYKIALGEPIQLFMPSLIKRYELSAAEQKDIKAEIKRLCILKRNDANLKHKK